MDFVCLSKSNIPVIRSRQAVRPQASRLNHYPTKRFKFVFRNGRKDDLLDFERLRFKLVMFTSRGPLGQQHLRWFACFGQPARRQDVADTIGPPRCLFRWIRQYITGTGHCLAHTARANANLQLPTVGAHSAQT
jgi:hypothetical protein